MTTSLRFSLLALVLVAGCAEDHERDPLYDCVVAGPPDAGAPDDGEPLDVDLLLMVDNSNSMAEEQVNLAQALPELIRAIVSGDVDGDGVPETTPARTVRAGVITSDMGTGGFTVPSCLDSMWGDDGVLADGNEGRLDGCSPASGGPRFLTYDPASSLTPRAFADELACVSVTGTGGCGFEQPLEAVLKALTPSTSPISFFGGTTGHGDGPNAGFLRDDSVLAVVLLTDEDDCSARDPDLYNQASTTYLSDVNVRCVLDDEALHPIERYVDGLLALRPGAPGRLVFITIAGVPIDLSGSREDNLLSDVRMESTVDPTNPQRLSSACSADTGIAYPPRRIVQVSDELRRRGAHTAAVSICIPSFVDAVRLAAESVGDAIVGPACPGAG
ncbi:MAG: hypothetical protein AB7S26_38210 [Sandaracinaceae bacterium]